MNGSYITTETSSLETFSSLEEDFVQKKLFVNNNIHVILQNNGIVFHCGPIQSDAQIVSFCRLCHKRDSAS